MFTKKTTSGNESAFPYLDGDGNLTMSEIGLTKRELFAALALQGLLSNPFVMGRTPKELVESIMAGYDIPDLAVLVADNLIERLNEVE
ncbi:hypothetical protein Glo7428_3164 [Gloeocapsa sp. PCC 7428]|uniref:hypothetical protein n=1 Tax=Gloeocapsa sp. PCC 7428 TaxID=1173026 RepID=UPI0002A61542|nr:hypothetical protein [Gloeocapsa sp. PCC 7428]AFZ31651.1 hypothetical protein Glo7428_3164 [Gloeocapsa sp. PCC 7428]